MRHVEIRPLALERLAPLLEPERRLRLRRLIEQARTLLGGRVVWNISSTAQGGGVAEMLQTLIAYARGAGVDARWLVLRGAPDFFAITKRVHNALHGDGGDGGPLGELEHRRYQDVLDDNLIAIVNEVRAGDIVLLHDPQTAGLARGLAAAGLHVVWRSHIGRDAPNARTEEGWAFLRPYLEHANAFIFSRADYPPPWIDPRCTWIIPPSIDPFITKNVELAPEQVRDILRIAHLCQGHASAKPVQFPRRDGRCETMRHHHGLLVDNVPAPPLEARLVVQVSRWDRLKDMAGVMRAFADHIGELPDDVHLMLAGPEVSGVSDDPEGAQVLAECISAWRALPPAAHARIHLACLAMDDVDENALIVNALQRHACTVVQKSLVEGFGLTVTEAMWKARPVVASAVGGIQDQITDGENGLLVRDPADLDAFAAALRRTVDDAALAARLGGAARERVRDEFLGDRHLIQYLDLFGELLGASAAA
ncbi:MAG: glycosyltransferase [Deltaproteobacteria bacterium]|nr:glycosyltransferase [Deltaproteobacteria bacterium]